MGQPYVGEIRLFAGNFAPAGWMFCDGTTLNISDYDTLFNLIGTTYGGDGQNTFALPDLRGRVPIHQGSHLGTNFQIAQQSGAETVTLSVQQIPAHNHPLGTTTATASQANAGAALLAESSAVKAYNAATPTGTLDPSAVAPAGGGQPHDNRQPYLGLNFIISLFGVYPSQT